MAYKDLAHADTVTALSSDDSVLSVTSGSVRKISLSDLTDSLGKIISPIEILENTYAYGIEIDFSEGNSVTARVGNLDLHRSLPIQNLMRGCLLADDGTVNKYLPSGSWEGETRDGSAGQVMVEIPAHYRKVVALDDTGNKWRVMLSQMALPGYEFIRKTYCSAYEAAVDRTNLILCSVVNTAEQYRGGNNTADRDGTYRSLLGRPATNISLTNFRNYARNRGKYGYGGCGWNCYLYETHLAIFWLYVVEYANFNIQADYTSRLSSNGFRQGGLGAGVSNMPDWSAYNSTNPVVPCGATDSLGNYSGVVTYNVMASDGETVKYAAPVPRYRGIENPFGHLWRWTDGIHFRIAADTSVGSVVYTCYDPTKFQDSNYTGYNNVGQMARSAGWSGVLLMGEDGNITPVDVTGSSSTKMCDYFYTSIPSSGELLRGLHLGGSASYGANNGLGCVYSNHEPSHTAAHIGSRLCFIP